MQIKKRILCQRMQVTPFDYESPKGAKQSAPSIGDAAIRRYVRLGALQQMEDCSCRYRFGIVLI